jgi:hypothetical protein
VTVFVTVFVTVVVTGGEVTVDVSVSVCVSVSVEVSVSVFVVVDVSVTVAGPVAEIVTASPGPMKTFPASGGSMVAHAVTPPAMRASRMKSTYFEMRLKWITPY